MWLRGETLGLRKTDTHVFPDYFSFRHFLASSSYFWTLRLSSLSSLPVVHFIGCTTAVTLCHSLLFVVTRCLTHSHSLSLIAPLVVTRCTTHCHSLYYSLYHSLSLVATRCHLLSLVVTRCTTRLSFYK